MDNYIARQPILSKSGYIAAYELFYHQEHTSPPVHETSQKSDSIIRDVISSPAFADPNDLQTAKAIVQFFNQLDESSFLDGREAFLTFTPNLLMQNIPRVFDPRKLVIQVEENVLVHPVARMMLPRYKKQGYRLSLSSFQFNSRFMNILTMIDILKINFQGITQKKLETLISIAREFNLKLAAYHVDTPQARELAQKYDFDYLQGKCIADTTQSKKQKNPEYLQSNFFQLMAAVSKDEPELQEIAELISLDVTLTFSLLKMVNSAYFALPNRVKDTRQALTILGLGQLRQWIYLLSFGGEGAVADEIIKLSFQRGVLFQALVQEMQNFPLANCEAYMMGMFSTLDRLLNVPLEDALKSLPVSEELKLGLTEQTGPAGTLYLLNLAYEQGEWHRAQIYAAELGITMDLMSTKYLEAVDYVNHTWNSLTEPFDTSSDTSVSNQASMNPMFR